MSCIYIAAEAWAGCQRGSWALVGKGSREGLRQLTLVSMNTCGTKDGEICRQSTAAVLAVSFFSGEISCIFLQSKSL